MMLLAGKPLVHRIFERLKRCRSPDHLIAAVPDGAEDDVLANYLGSMDVAVFRGSESDVRARYLGAAAATKADIIVRIPADNVAPEPEEIDRVIDYHLHLGRRGFSSNLAQLRNSGYPDGIGAEVFETSLLEEAATKYFFPEALEHVHRNFFNYATDTGIDEKWCPISAPPCPADIRRPDIVLDVNTAEQYKRMSELYEALCGEDNTFGIREIIKWHDSRKLND